MGKFYLNKLPPKERIKLIAEFYDSINCLKSRNEVRLFFRDLLSPDEIAMLIRRVQVALLLQAGFTYHEIQDALRVGVDKIIAVQNSMTRHGEGYKFTIKRLRKIIKNREKKEERRKREQMVSFPGLDYLKRKYPTHFLLFNLIDELNNWLDDDGKLKIEREMEFRRRSKKR